MRKILYGADSLVAKFAINLLQPDVDDFGPCSTIGIIDDDKLIAGVIFNHYYGTDIQATIASISPYWASRKILGKIFSYPFLQLQCQRITAQTRENNSEAIDFLKRLGFKQEGVLRQWYGNEAALVFGMIKSECIWINKN
ncbi:MAG: N-acetyltransferase [Alphaproteobacteria bacterium]|nr:MAG: N-acetyltransferase [Alphaproteobacteria bacterium]